MTRVRIENAQYLVTVDDNDRILTNATVVIEDGIITSITDKRRRAERKGDRQRRAEGEGRSRTEGDGRRGAGGGAGIVEEAAGWDWREHGSPRSGRACGWSAAD